MSGRGVRCLSTLRKRHKRHDFRGFLKARNAALATALDGDKAGGNIMSGLLVERLPIVQPGGMKGNPFLKGFCSVDARTDEDKLYEKVGAALGLGPSSASAIFVAQNASVAQQNLTPPPLLAVRALSKDLRVQRQGGRVFCEEGAVGLSVQS